MMVKTAYITKELSQLLGVTRQGAIQRALREGWEARTRNAKGGGNEWLVHSMPKETREAIAISVASNSLMQDVYNLPATASDMFTVNSSIEILKEKAKHKRASARAYVVNMASSFQRISGATRTSAYETFCMKYNDGAIEVPAWVKSFLPSVCRKSITNWEDALIEKGLLGVSDNNGTGRTGTGVIDSTDGMAEYIASEIFEFYNISAASIMEALEAKFDGKKLPTIRSLQRWISKYRKDNAQMLMLGQNPDGWRSKYQSAAGSRSAGITRCNQVWELDSSPTDVILAGGVRYTLIGGIDVATRRAVLHVAKTSNSQGVCSLLRRALLNFGVPETLKMDNGADYTSHQVMTALFDLEIKPDWCTPFSPDEKPHIERFFQTFQHGFCVRLEGFIGHCVADRKAIESRRSFAERVSKKSGQKSAIELRYTPEEFQKICDAWVQDNYNERLHSEVGMSPNEAAATLGGTIRRITNERALDILLLPLAGKNGLRVVSKKGLRIEGGIFNATELGGLEGQDVQVRRDEHDAGFAYVFDLDGVFICKAEDPSLTGVSLKELADARKAHQKRVIGGKVKEAKKIVAAVKPHETAALILEFKSKEAAEKRKLREQNLGAEKAVAYSTEALKEAAIAAAVQDLSKPAPMSQQEAENRKKFEDDWFINNIPKVDNIGPKDLASKEAFVTARLLLKRQNEGDKLRPAEVKWLFGYQSTIYSGIHQEMLEDFGETAFFGIHAFSI